MANGYSTGMMGAVITTPTVIPQNVTNAIRVNETTPNLQMIQSFPVVSRNGNIHIHQDPVSGQMYEMTDEFHSMIPQILAGTSNVMTGGVMPTITTNVGNINFISDNIENYLLVVVTEDTPNLSEILSYPIYASEPGFTFYKDPSLQQIYSVSDNLKNKSSLILQTRGTGIQNVVPDAITESDIFNETMVIRAPVFQTNTIEDGSRPIVRPQISNVFTVNESKIKFVYPNTSNTSGFNGISNSVIIGNSGVRFTYPSPR